MGQSGTNRIAGGTLASNTDFPYQVSLNSGPGNGSHFCSGMILTSYVVLTAAHCFKIKDEDGYVDDRSYTEVTVTAGKLVKMGPGATTDGSQISRLRGPPIFHDEYDYEPHFHDIVILELTDPFNFTSYISNVLMPTENMGKSNFSGNYTVSGWGFVPAEKDTGSQEALMKATVLRLSDVACKNRWGNSYMPEAMTCAAGEMNEDACQGDSGGPLTCYHKVNPQKKYLCGIVSFGFSNDKSYNQSRPETLRPCGKNVDDKPGVYTDVAKHYRWIMFATCKMRQDHECPVNYFQCCNKLCVHNNVKCDGIDDCGDASDETCDTRKFHINKCIITDVCPKLKATFLALFPKFIYSFTTYRMGIFLLPGKTPAKNYTFTVSISSENDDAFVREAAVKSLMEGQGSTLDAHIENIPRSPSYTVYVKVRDEETNYTFRYNKDIVRGGNLRVFIHTDKRTYDAGETVHFGVHFLDFDSEIYDNVSRQILVVDSKEHVLARWDNSDEARAVLKEFPLGVNVLGGTWKIVGNYSLIWNEVMYSKLVEQKFEVNGRAHLDFRMEIRDLPDYIPTLLAEDRKLRMRIDAYHFDGTGVLGECAVELKIIQEGCAQEISKSPIHETIHIHGSTGVRNFDFNDILMEDAANGARIQVKVTLTEKMTGLTLTKIATVRISRFEYKIQAFGINKLHRRGAPFYLGFRILDTMNQVFGPALTTGKGINVHHDFDGKSGRVNLTRGMVQLQLNSTPGQTNKEVQVNYEGLTLNYTILVAEPDASVDARKGASLQIQLIEPVSPNGIAPGSALLIRVLTTEKIESINYAIFSNSKLISADSATLGERSEFEITYPREIGEESQVVVFTFIDDVHVSDSLSLTTEMTQEAPDPESADLSSSATTVEPGQDIILTVKVPPGSDVYLFGFDESALEGQEDFLTPHWFERSVENTSAECIRETLSGYFDLKRAGMTVLTNAANQTSTPGEDECGPPTDPNCPRALPTAKNQMGETFFTRSLVNLTDLTDVLITLPQRISSWVATGYFVETVGAQPKFLPRISLKTTKRLQASIHLPFSIAEGELLQVPVFIHNNLGRTENCMVSYKIQGPNNEITGEHLGRSCTANGTAEYFPMNFNSIGMNKISVKVEVGDESASTEKSILVRSTSEKHDHIMSSAYLAFPQDLNDTINFKQYLVGLGNPPELVIFQRSRAHARHISIPKIKKSTKLYVASDIMAYIIPNVNQLVPVPQSAMESQLLQFTANLAILSYLKESKQNESPPARHALLSLKSGYQFILSRQRDDGSFTEFGSKESDRPIWLTSYIIRNLLLARRYIYIDPQVLTTGLEFLKEKQQNGIFQEKGHISGKSHIPLTAFVLLTFVEGQRSIGNYSTFTYDDVIQGARNIFEAYYNSKLKKSAGIDNAHAQVLMTYAEHLWHEVNGKVSNVTRDKYWKSILSDGRVNSSLWVGMSRESEVELLSYVALTCHLRGSYFHAVAIMNRLFYQRLSETGGFLSTTDTAVALMALAKISGRGDKNAINYKLSVHASHRGANYTHIADHPMVHSLEKKEIILPKNERGVKLTATGKGTVFAQIVYSYYTPRQNRSGPFAITHVQKTDGGKLTLKICVKKRTEGSSGLAVLDVNLPSGYKFLQIPTSQALAQVSGHRSHEFAEMNSQVRIIFSSISNAVETCTKVEAIRVFSVENYAAVGIKAYEFYHVRRLSQIYYTLGK